MVRAMTLRFLAPALIATASLGVAASAHAGAVATCHGLRVTTTKSSGDISGTPGRDVIRLTGPGTVASGAGADVICGSRFADRIDAGPGDDVVLGGKGHDSINGQAGRDSLFGEGGNDRLVGGPGRDVLHGGAGRDRVVTRPMPRVAGENGLAGSDIVMAGSYAVSVLTDNASLQTLMMAGQQFTYSWLPQGGTGASFMPVWIAMRPLMSNVVGIGPGIAAYWDESGPLVPGLRLEPSQVWPASWGGQVALDGDGYGVYSFNDSTYGMPGTFTIASGPSIPVAPMVATGLAQEGNANGMRFVQPAQVVQAQPNLATRWSPLTRMRVSVAPYPEPGEVVDPQQPGSQYIDVSIGEESPTAAISYNQYAGFLQD